MFHRGAWTIGFAMTGTIAILAFGAIQVRARGAGAQSLRMKFTFAPKAFNGLAHSIKITILLGGNLIPIRAPPIAL